tara:strand:+ start:589 stop:981 length:393 start_codon:yes stop_codon:yes gene_type:complete
MDITDNERKDALLCTLRALKEIKKIRTYLKQKYVSSHTNSGWERHTNSYANLQNVYSTKVDGKSIHAFPFHDLEDTKNFVGELKKCAGFTVNHRTNTFYVHSTINTIYNNTNKEKQTSKKQNWHTLYTMN